MVQIQAVYFGINILMVRVANNQPYQQTSIYTINIP